MGITILALLYRNLRPTTNLLRLSLGLQMGGAAGNLLDRLLQGHVTDFVDIGPWPVFNVADSSIVTGLVLLFWLHGIPWERFGRGRLEVSAAQSALKEHHQSSWCPVCDGVMEPVMQGWRCSTCGVKERIDQVMDGYQPLPDRWAFGASDGSSLDSVYHSAGDLRGSRSQQTPETPDPAVDWKTPISQHEDGQNPGISETDKEEAARPPDFVPEEMPE